MDFFNSILESLKNHAHVLFTGSLGATFGFLLSKDPLRDRFIGFLSGFILCMVFSEPASHFIANDSYPELFGFVLGAVGKSGAETVLDLIRSKIISTVSDKTGQPDSPACNHDLSKKDDNNV